MHGAGPPVSRPSLSLRSKSVTRRVNSYDARTQRDLMDDTQFSDNPATTNALGLQCTDMTTSQSSISTCSQPRRLSFSRAITPTPSSFSSISTLASCPSPSRYPLDLPVTTISKAERDAAREQLDPSLREALRVHEQELERERRFERRPSWLSRHRRTSRGAEELLSPLEVDDQVHPFVAYSPPPLPELVIDDESEPEDDAEEQDLYVPYCTRSGPGSTIVSYRNRSASPTTEHLRLQLASISLRVDFAVFRAKKRLRRGLGLE